MRTSAILAKILEDEPDAITTPITIRKKENVATFEALAFVDKARVKRDLDGFKLQRVEVKQGRLAATDGHRLHWSPVKDIPDGLWEVSKQSNTYTLDLVKDKNPQFPNLDAEICHWLNIGHKTTVDRKDFLRCARQANIITDNYYRGVILSFNGKLEVKANNPDLGDMETETATTTPINPEVTLGINAKYLIEALQGLKAKTIDVKVSAHDAPIILTDRVNTALIMPVRI